MENQRSKSRLFVLLGFSSVALGTAGIFLPLLPTTPFMLLAGYLFARSSARWHRWLLNHRYFGPYIRSFRNKGGLTATQKLRIGLSFTVAISISAYFAPIPAVRYFLGGLWLFWMAFLLRMKTAVIAATSGEA
ncbi:MAG: YbaN family protein [Planctomycetota bacterium]